MEKIETIRPPAPGNEVVIPLNADMYALCSNTDLIRINPLIYGRSDACKRMTLILTREILTPYNKSNYSLDETQNYVLMLPECPVDAIVPDVVRDFTDLYKLLALNDQLMLDLCILQDNVIIDGFIINIQREADTIWDKNKVLLQPTDTREFYKRHFTTPGGAPGAPGYGMPNVNSEMYKPYKIKPVNLENHSDELLQLEAEDLDHIFEALLIQHLDRVAVRLAQALLCHMRYCHIMLKLESLKVLAKTFPQLRYYMFYAWRVMYLEEKSKYITSQQNDRFIFTIDQLNNLPILEFGVNTPYLPIITRGLITLTGQATVPCTVKNGTRGFYSLVEFEKRLANYTANIFKGLNWYKTALCGSAITACAVRNPLEQYVGDLQGYFEEYYPSNPAASERPRVVHMPKEESYEAYELDEDDIDSVPVNYTAQDGSEPPHAADTTESDDESNYIPQYTDLDLMIETENSEEFDTIAARHFDTIRGNTTRKLTLERVETENKYKYRITGLPREVEMFMVNSIPGVIVKFHLGCVRAWYDGKQLYGFPSFACTGATGLNFDMRWVSCNKDLRDIVLKYYQRGFGFLVNSQDRDSMRTHINGSEVWPHVQVVNAGAGRWRMRHFNRQRFLHDVSAQMFNPSSSRRGIHYGLVTPSRRVLIDDTLEEGDRRGRRGKPTNCIFRTAQGVVHPRDMAALIKKIT